ncbi:MAG TPA: methyltransferase domain-containing protein [Gaiellaceae bacterium]|nr:methyltransferase domain-containing protein [Gaiellaceae bacterium]
MANVRLASHFRAVAGSYDRMRPADESWWEVFERIVAAGDLDGRRTLDVGCGTGTFAVALAERGGKVWGVDASPEMLSEARAKGSRARFKEGNAEALPFKDGWFERVVMRLSLQHVDRPRALAEAARVLVPGGRIAIASFDPKHFSSHWLSGLFPSLAEIDEARFPDAHALEAELRAAGFVQPAFDCLPQPGRVSRSEALERIRGRYITTLRLIDDAEFKRGLAAAEAELPAEVEHQVVWLFASAEKPPLDAVRTPG